MKKGLDNLNDNFTSGWVVEYYSRLPWLLIKNERDQSTGICQKSHINFAFIDIFHTYAYEKVAKSKV